MREILLIIILFICSCSSSIATRNSDLISNGSDNKGTDNIGTDNKGTDNKGTGNKGTKVTLKFVCEKFDLTKTKVVTVCYFNEKQKECFGISDVNERNSCYRSLGGNNCDLNSTSFPACFQKVK